ncbi:MAG: DMT family transporter [Gemmatimonadales bacterium]
MARGFSRFDVGLLGVSLIWGANFSVSKLALGHLGPLPFAALRFILSSVVLMAVLWGVERSARIPRPALWRLLAWGVVGHTLNQAFFLNGLQHTTATNSALIFATLPVVVAVLGIATGRERPEPRVWAGIGLGTVGVVLVVAAQGAHFTADTLLGDALTIAAVICWASFLLGLRDVAMSQSALQVAAITHLGGTPGLVLAAAPGLAAVELTSLSPMVWIALIYSSVFSSLVAMVLWTRGLKALGGSRTALYNCVTPVFAALVAWLLLGERPAPLQGVGAVLVIGGILVSRAPAQAEEV